MIALQQKWERFWTILRGIVAELSDQNAYQRYLCAHGRSHSAEEWRKFQDHYWEGKARRGRCC